MPWVADRLDQPGSVRRTSRPSKFRLLFIAKRIQQIPCYPDQIIIFRLLTTTETSVPDNEGPL